MGKYSEALRKRLRRDPKPASPRQEQREIEPHVHFFFGPHGTPADIAAMEPAFAQCDIYVPEALGHTPANLAFYQAVADGKIQPDDSTALKQYGMNTGPFALAQYRLIAGSGKRIAFIDQPIYTDLALDQLKVSSLPYYAMGELFNGNADRSINLMGATLRHYADRQSEREQLIIRNLKQFLKTLKPQGKPAQILVRLGSSHTNVAHTLETDHAVTHKHQLSPVLFGPLDQAMRRATFGKEPAVTLELAKGLLLEHLLMSYMQVTFQPDDVQRVDPIGDYRRKVVQRYTRDLSVDDLTTFAQHCAALQLPLDVKAFAQRPAIPHSQFMAYMAELDAALQTHQLALPKTLDDLVKMAT
ncbi:MAG: hypothetical protein HY565_04375 [Candidatus Kerfeldbacteria bacterium]|nr:hypothetical protein [Candidatus Kerfeldbacteria bacterium]